MKLKLKHTPDVDILVTDLISNTEAKNHLRLKHSEEDTLLTPYTLAAYRYVEQRANRFILSQTWTGFLNWFPSVEIDLAQPNVTAVTHVKYNAETTGTLTTLSTDVYEVDFYTPTGIIVLKTDQSWPETFDQVNAVEVKFVAGWAVADVPEDIVNAIKLVLTYLWDNRGADTVAAGFAQEIPMGKTIDKLINHHRMSRTP